MRRLIFVARILGLIAAIILTIALWPANKAEATVSRWDDSVVYVENHAPGWPVKRAANNLDNGSSLTLKVVRKCPPNRPCIRVYSTWSLSGRQIGLTSTSHLGSRTVAVQVLLENKWGNRATNKQRRGLVCHELGHAVGLNHSWRGNTCMKQGASKKRPAHISKSERRQLDRWY